ncbi:MAG: preprotein translocase subunit SecD [Actinomycetota bacterium]|nr:preprotein translocase subunit SecD [Actinomycetota bacterium]
MARPGASRGLHVGRYLGALAAILVLLYAIVALAGPNSDPLTPKLGLDLQGGASVTLTPKTTPKAGQLQTAVDILNRRVNGAGVAEAEVVTQGNNIVVSLPGGNRSSLKGLATTAQLRFREVLDQPLPGSTNASPQPTAPSVTTTVQPKPQATTSAAPSKKSSGRALSAGLLAAPTPTPTASASATSAASPRPSASSSSAADDGVLVHTGDVYTPAALAALDCSDKNARRAIVDDDPSKEIVACSDDGSVKYHLAAAKVVGTDVKTAAAQRDQTLGEWQIIVKFTGKGQNRWTDLTAATVGKQVAVALDAVVISAPQIKERIDGDAQISGSFTRKSAADLANVLKYGALPLSFDSGQVEVVSPTLGKDQLHSGLLAGGIGLIAVIIYSLLYYRMMGFVTIASLLMSGLLVYASVAILGKQIGFALSLAGIAGFIVAVGITADSFVVFFERLKDEIKEGRTPRSAVDRAWVRARRTILSADTVSFLAAIILYFVSVGGVRGFAFTLGLSTLLDVVVVFLFTRPLVSWLSRFGWFSNHRFTGFYGPGGGAPVTNAGPRRPAPTTTAMPTSEA